MNPNLTPIYRMKFIPAHLVTDYLEYPDGTVQIKTFESLRSISFATGSQSFQSTSKPSKAGQLFSSTISTTLREAISYIGPVIVLIQLCDSKILVFGNPDIPIYFGHTHTDQSRAFQVDYDSDKPLLQLKNTHLFND